jgi:hypothetical protein
MIDSKNTNDTDNDSVTQSSLSNLFKAAENRLYPGMFSRKTRAFITLSVASNRRRPPPFGYISADSNFP